MVKYQDIKGMEIFSVDEGKAWGKITEVLVNSKKFEAVGFVVKDKAFKFMNISDVTTFGENSIVFKTGKLLEDMSVVKKKKNIVQGDELPGLKVITKKGSDGGRVESFYFREEDGKITHFELSKGSFSGKGLLSVEGVSFLGPDAMIVDDSAVKVAMEMQTKGSLKSVLGKISKKTKEFSSDVANKIRSVKDSGEKQMITLKKETEKTAGAAIDKVKTESAKVGEKTKKISKKAGKEISRLKKATKDKVKKVKTGTKKIIKKKKD